MSILKALPKWLNSPDKVPQHPWPAAIILIRFMLGLVFLSEGIQKFLFSDQLGVGRFMKIGIPQPEILAPIVGGIEITGGLLLLAGFLTRPACFPLLSIMLVAIISTKLGLLQTEGFWRMAHEARTDFCMLMGLCFITLVGAGPWSLDNEWAKRRVSST
ncbi:DoxX family protein [Vampirovibrio sp.]|uniref:DoxX family protein n=1 Tax=Vampirovibrio sp. TaxID=2717857 RepID=UPI003593B633